MDRVVLIPRFKLDLAYKANQIMPSYIDRDSLYFKLTVEQRILGIRFNINKILKLQDQ